jgi:tetratricopeptide (TPR) repeat protein
MTSPGTRLLNPLEIGVLVELVDQNRLIEAEQQCRSWLQIFPEAGMLWKILSVALIRQRKDALIALRRTADLMPLDPEAHSNLGSALLEQGRWAEAVESLQRALTLEPRNLDVLVQAADATRELGRASDAVNLYRRALRLDPRHPQALNNLGNAFLTLGQFADAAGHYRLALEIEPDDVQILCNLANAQRRLGYHDDALANIRRALTLDPTSSIAHSHLGLILAATGDQEAAIASYRQALILNPKQVDALNNLGVALRDLGFRRDAVALHARAIQCEPRRAESHYDLGMALFEMRRFDDAIAGYREALALKPDHAPAHLNLGIAMRQRRRPVDAEASCRAALAIDPNYVDALAFLGELYADRGQFAEAERLFWQAIALNPDYAPAFASIATHRKMSVNDTDWVRGAEGLLAKRPSPRDEISLRYALGKYCDDIKSYEGAFEHYARANALRKRQQAAYDGAKLTQHIDQIMRSCNSASIRDRNAAAAVSPIFIVGMPRSGTSLAEQILASHPAVYGAGEVSFWDAAYRSFRQAELEGKVDDGLLSRMAKNYLEHLASVAPGDKRVVDKLPANFLYAGLIHKVFPRARILHMRRHPIDTCLSIYFQNFFNIGPYANDLEHLAHYYGEYRRITAHWRDVLPPGTLLDIPYEDLLDDQETWTRRMLDFVGLPWDPRCLDFDQTERVVITASKWQVRQKMTKASVGRWRHYERFVGPLRGLIDFNGVPK